jgi:hypothetical protein
VIAVIAAAASTAAVRARGACVLGVTLATALAPGIARELTPGGAIVNLRHLLGHLSDTFELIFQKRLGHRHRTPAYEASESCAKPCGRGNASLLKTRSLGKAGALS